MALELSARSILTQTFFKTAEKLYTRSIVCWAQPLGLSAQKGRVFVSVSKKHIARATQRNRVKRVLHAQCRVHPMQPLQSFTLFLSIKSPNETQITRDLDQVIHKLSTKNPNHSAG